MQAGVPRQHGPFLPAGTTSIAFCGCLIFDEIENIFILKGDVEQLEPTARMNSVMQQPMFPAHFRSVDFEAHALWLRHLKLFQLGCPAFRRASRSAQRMLCAR